MGLNSDRQRHKVHNNGFSAQIELEKYGHG